MKCTNFVGPFDPFRLPAPGRPPGSKHPWGPKLGWYRFRPGASRRGEYPNGSNIKNIRFVMKCTDFVGPFGPFRRPAPGRPPGSKHPRGPTLGWYSSRPGASRRGEYPNCSNIKTISFMMKCAKFVGPLDPFRRPAPGRPPVPSTYGDLDRVGIGPVLGQAVGANIQTGPTSKISVLLRNAPISLVHLTHSDGLPQDDLLVPSTHEDLHRAVIGPVLGQAVGVYIQTGQTSRISVLWRNAQNSLVHWTHSDSFTQDDLLVPSTHRDLDSAGIGPVLGQAEGAIIQTGPTSKISVWWWNATISLVHLTHSDGLPQDDLLVPRTHGNLYLAGIGPVLGQAVRANTQTDQTSRISVLWRNAPISLVHLTDSDGLPQDDLLVPSTHEDLEWAGIGHVLGQAVGANIQTGPTSRISVCNEMLQFRWSFWPIQTACPRTTSWFQAPMGT